MSTEGNTADPAHSGDTTIVRSSVGRFSSHWSKILGGSQSLRATGRFLRGQLWSWPILAALILGLVGWWLLAMVENTMRDNRREALTTILNADVTAMRVWLGQQEHIAQVIGQKEALIPLVAELVALGGAANPERGLLQSSALGQLRSRLKVSLKLAQFGGFFLVSSEGMVLAADQDPPIGKSLIGYRKEFFARISSGQTTVSRPFRSPLLLSSAQGEQKAELPSMFVGTPIRDASGKVLAALGLRIRPEESFTRILQVARSGLTGETYAINRDGLLLSQSRFDDDLKQLGLLEDRQESQSILTLEIRDPQVNVAQERPKIRRAEQPLTHAAAEVVQGKSGHDVDGYRDYRGVYVIGAWEWLPDYDFGVISEIDVDESFRPLRILQRAFWILMGLLGLSAIGIFVAMLYMARQQRYLQQARLAARQLGQYTLTEKIGSGGMGTVYKARHALLRRPTAVKLMDLEKISDVAIRRFEREVQITSTLTHPNTVAVYDYGRTPEGIFYYAMEYLEGINLEDFIKRYGPMPENRALFVLQQLCGALAEAHAAGLVHRDVKPANLFLTRRGGLYDFVKVLDFGLVKNLDQEENLQQSAANLVAGTPLYLSPEAATHPEQISARSDVYAIGAVAYFLVTGHPVFTGSSVVNIFMKHAREAPVSPSEKLQRTVHEGLERIILRCLAKAPQDRPADAGELLQEILTCNLPENWTQADARRWWQGHGATAAGETQAEESRPTGKMTSIQVEATMAYEGQPMD